MKTLNFKKGFTLIEIMIVTAIIALISVTIGVSFSVVSSRYLETQTQKLAGDLSWVRAMARATRQDYLINFDVDGDTTLDGSYTIFKIDPDGIEPDSIVGRKKIDVDGLVLQSAPGTTEFSFNHVSGGLNSAIADPLVIELWRRGARANITIRSLTGHISWERL
ncbi:MAG: prepilin-type N-terminal cleavage/methylation domain-containing protein [Candidatus Omnitrophota bacterium]